MGKFFFALLIFVPLSVAAAYLGASGTVVFFLSAIAVVPLAKYIGEATEELASRTTPALGGLLNATFGNAPELIIGLFALNAGLVDVVKASITGSIVGNLLFVLGMSMFAGGWREEKQTFNRTGVLAAGSTLFIGAVALIIPAVFAYTQVGEAIAGLSVERLSLVVSAALMLMYVSTLVFSLHTHKHLYLGEVGRYEPRWSTARSLVVLCAATLAVAWVSDLLVASIEPVLAALHWSALFVGVVIIAIIGNAAEHFSAVNVARKGRMDLSLYISIGSATQIALFVAPFLVFASLALGRPMNFLFDTFELVSIVLSVFAVNLIVADGESNWLEGVQLMVAYAIIAVAFFFHP